MPASRPFLPRAVIALTMVPWMTAAAAELDSPAFKDRVDPLPPQLQAVAIDEQLGARLPRLLRFRNERGEIVRLGSYFAGHLPLILSFNYSSCSMLCSLQLSALVAAVRDQPLRIGRQFEIITIGLDPSESVQAAAQAKDRYISALPLPDREPARAGWHFLTGDQSAIESAAKAVGYGYRYLPERREYAHPAALIFLSSSGTVTRYFKGIDYRPNELHTSIIDAGLNKTGNSLGFLLACLHYDAEEGSYAAGATTVMRYGGIAFALAFVAAVGAWHLRRSRQPEGELPLS